jgi:diguanylate cyclase (GGDEF)-like protein
MEILQRSINAVINQFGYAEAAISLLTKDNKLEVAAIGGTEDFGYSPGFQQELGTGIIGHTAEIRKTYISNNVSEDPYYFSNDKHYGSAISIPIVNEGNLFGVLYVESSAPTEFGAHDIQTLETLANQISSSIQRAILYNQAQESLKFMSAVQAVTKAVTSSLDLKIIFETVVSGLKLLFGYSHISIYILNGEYLELGAQVGYPEDAAIHKIHISQGVSGRAVKTKLAQFIRDASQEPSFLRADPTVSSEICIPLIKDDKVLGMFNVEGNANHLLTDNDLNLLSTLAGPIALALDNARLHAQVKEMALTDAVTGLSSRHAFEHTLTTEVERAKRLDLQLSLIIFDLDSFKEYNDTWGHPAGDVRLKATADLIRANLRKYDLAARFGGDEFAIIMPNTDKNGALELAKRLQSAARASTKDTPIEGKGVSGYTISLGLATFPEDGNTFETLLFGADQAELTAKRTGKNRIVLAGETSKYVED